MRTKQLSLYGRVAEWVHENVVSSVLAVVIVLQVPFTVLYFTSRPQEAVANQASSTRHIASDKKEARPTVKLQLLPSRPDPFALLPGMEMEKEKMRTDQQNLPPIYDAFGGQPVQASGSLPNLPKPADLDVKSGSPSATNTQLQPAPVQIPVTASPVASQSYSIKLTGVVRFHGKAVAIFQMRDKSTVHTFEGERVSGTDCLVETILPNKVYLKRDAGSKVEQDWLFVGEEWRV